MRPHSNGFFQHELWLAGLLLLIESDEPFEESVLLIIFFFRHLLWKSLLQSLCDLSVEFDEGFVNNSQRLAIREKLFWKFYFRTECCYLCLHPKIVKSLQKIHSFIGQQLISYHSCTITTPLLLLFSTFLTTQIRPDAEGLQLLVPYLAWNVRNKEFLRLNW